MILKVTSVLACSRRRIQARSEDLVKVTVKFIRKEIGEKRVREKPFPFPTQEMGAKTRRCSPVPSFILESWGNTHGQG
jgi:hypothetical protein